MCSPSEVAMNRTELQQRFQKLNDERDRIRVAEQYGFDPVTLHMMVANAIERADVLAQLQLRETA